MPTRRDIKSFMNEREMLPGRVTRQTDDSQQEGPANNPMGGIKPNLADGQKYSTFNDARLKSLATTILGFIGIVVVTGKLMEYVVDKYIMGPSTNSLSDLPKAGEKNYKIALLKGEEFSSAIGHVSIYKSENSLIEELANLQKLDHKNLKMKDTFFSKGKNYFI